MTVLRRGKSKYWYIQFQVGGRTIIKSSRSTSRKVADQMEVQLRAQVHAQTYMGHKPSLTVGEALNRFVGQKEGAANYRNLVGHARAIQRSIQGSLQLDNVTSGNLDTFIRARQGEGIGLQALKHGLNTLRGAIDLAKRQGYRTPDLYFPTIRVPGGRLRYLTGNEESSLLAALDPERAGKGLSQAETRSPEMQAALQDLYDLVILLLDTGARCGEISRLEWRQVDFDQQAIHLWRPKVRNEALIFMTRRAYGVLRRRHESKTGPFVFTNKKGEARGHPHKSWRKAFDRAGLHDCTIHTLRHTHATRLIQNGMSVYEVQTVLGHTDPKTTMRYAHLEQTKVTAKARDVINKINQATSV